MGLRNSNSHQLAKNLAQCIVISNMDENESAATRATFGRSLITQGLGLLLCTVAVFFTSSLVVQTTATICAVAMLSVALLALADKRNRRRPTKLRPFGYGREAAYWATMAAFVLVVVTGVLSVRFGFERIVAVTPVIMRHGWLAFVSVAAVAAASLWPLISSLQALLGGEPLRKTFTAFVVAPAITPKSASIIDATVGIGAATGLASLALHSLSGQQPQFDGIGALAMGLVLLLAALGLLISIRSLVIGQGAPREVERKIRDAAREIPEVKHVVGMHTTMVGSDTMLANIDVNLKDGLSTDQVEKAVEKVREITEQTEQGLKVHVEPDAEPEALHPHAK